MANHDVELLPIAYADLDEIFDYIILENHIGKSAGSRHNA